MKPWQAVNSPRSGLSLLEMMVATAIMATLMGSVVVLVRGSHAAWNAYEEDFAITENAYGVLRHFTRQLRQATVITDISLPTNNSGNLSFLTTINETKIWDHDGALSQITFSDGTNTQVLARDIDQLTFNYFEADGVTPTTELEDIQVILCTVQVTLPRGAGETRTVSTRAWLRSW